MNFFWKLWEWIVQRVAISKSWDGSGCLSVHTYDGVWKGVLSTPFQYGTDLRILELWVIDKSKTLYFLYYLVSTSTTLQ